MTKKEIKEVLKRHGYTLINSSWYISDDKDTYFFNAFDCYGECFKFYIDTLGIGYATCQHLSDVCLHESIVITCWFFK